MATENVIEPLKAGTFVKILNSGYSRARIAEYLGQLGPKGAPFTVFLSRGSPGACTSRSLKSSSRYWTMRESRQVRDQR